MDIKSILKEEVRALSDRKLHLYEIQKGNVLAGLANIAALHEMIKSYQRVIKSLEKEQ